MRGWFLVKGRLIGFYHSPVILGCFTVWIYPILSEPTLISSNVKSIFLVSFLCKTIFSVRTDREKYYEDSEDREAVLFADLETVPQ